MSRVSITFVGTATTVIRVGTFTLLTDPNFLRRGCAHTSARDRGASGSPTRRWASASCPLDAVLLSHLRGDYWDRVARAGLDRSVRC